jgi:hypothetical protein
MILKIKALSKVSLNLISLSSLTNSDQANFHVFNNLKTIKYHNIKAYSVRILYSQTKTTKYKN